VHVTFDDCTGPFGLVHLNGEIVVTLSAGPGGALRADLAGNGLTANDQALTYAASADITVDGAIRDVDWHGEWTVTTPKGRAVEHTSDLTIVVDTAAGCVTSDGTASTTVGSRGVDTTFEAYEVCRDESGEVGCPTGAVTHTGKKSGNSVAVEFDGSDEGHVITATGQTFDVPLVCGGGA
jgi:hypothetical protein